MGNCKTLAELAPADTPFGKFVEHGIRVIVKSLHIGAGQEHKRIGGTADIEFRGAAIVHAMEIADGEGRLRSLPWPDHRLHAQKYFGDAVYVVPDDPRVDERFARREEFQPRVNGKFHYLVGREARCKFGGVAGGGQARFKLQVTCGRKSRGSGNRGTTWVRLWIFADRCLRAGSYCEKCERGKYDKNRFHLVFEAVAR